MIPSVKDDGLTILEEKDHATGRRLQEIEYKEATTLDLFNRDPLRGPYGTKANPSMVPSEYDSRLVGCPGGCTPVSALCRWTDRSVATLETRGFACCGRPASGRNGAFRSPSTRSFCP